MIKILIMLVAGVGVNLATFTIFDVLGVPETLASALAVSLGTSAVWIVYFD